MLVCASVVSSRNCPEGAACTAGYCPVDSRARSMRPTSSRLASSSGTNLSSMPGGLVASPESARMRVTVPSPKMSGCPSASSSVKRTRVPAGCDDLVKMKMRSSLMNREYLLTKV